MRNGGEACTAANRFYVQAGIAADFAAGLAERMQALTVGPGLDNGVDAGPLVNLSSRDKVASLVDHSVAAGARLLTGGATIDRPGYFYAPTVLTQVPATASVLREEIFGPVAPIVEFDAEGEAVAAANDTEYGLVSYVYTRDLSRGLRIAEILDAGMIGLNRGVVSDPAAPFGGTKQSGIGREGGHEGLLEYTESKYIATSW
jgi:succinate-semialdehyde dehydrogenase / glutarate-semialdehyde dehydrogenase